MNENLSYGTYYFNENLNEWKFKSYGIYYFKVNGLSSSTHKNKELMRNNEEQMSTTNPKKQNKVKWNENDYNTTLILE